MKINNISFTSGINIPVQEKYQALKSNATPVVIKNVEKDVDEYVMAKNKKDTIKVQAGFFVGSSVLGLAVTQALISNAKKKLSQGSAELAKKLKYLKELRVGLPVLFALIAIGSYANTEYKKNKNIITKKDIYRSQGFNIAG